ncbi:MAG: hypothetical protein A2W98_04970 [Bacteroidetes bacterium GWF2_33_38]|nr:MAG: hypothetical protein A2W98_04970 [Bacteroidetes bacterium GWF2_33_38]OFY75640.1 MAG: hypothetical protein A2265_00060 [Bacteroidetes bacterium RIFOXYA12_FULL_33_9]OFY90646.1 MAG: hypothetical protein A2236_02630 [Bacteroidetes bacterium RIFOXYA2_FULL_33_7]
MSLDKLPLSLGYLASSIKENTNWEVKIYNADFYAPSISSSTEFLTGSGFSNYIKNLTDNDYKVWNEIKDYVKDYNPEVVGITTKSQNYRSACNTAQIIKEINPSIKIIIGGPHVSLTSDEDLNRENIDITVKGEGELTIIEILNAVESNLPFDNIAGVSFKNNGDVTKNILRGQIQDLDILTSPYKYAKTILKDFEKYPLNSFRSIFATRGCPYNCTFCGSGKIWGHKVRFRSVKNVIDEINELRKIGVNYFNFDDDTFGATSKYIVELCNSLIENCRGIQWSCELHVKLITPNHLSLMKKAGCDLIKIGIESGNNEILKQIRKNITIEEAINASKLINKYKIHAMGFFMVGFPQETIETLNDTINAIKKFNGYVTYSIFTPYIGTDAYDYCVSYGLIPKIFDVSKYNHQSPENCFCLNITHDKFRAIASEVEKVVDKKNLTYGRYLMLKRFFPTNILRKIKRSFRIFKNYCKK